jgi:hypothetical protein
MSMSCLASVAPKGRCGKVGLSDLVSFLSAIQLLANFSIGAVIKIVCQCKDDQLGFQVPHVVTDGLQDLDSAAKTIFPIGRPYPTLKMVCF